MNTKIQVGSRAFFSEYPDFEPTDNDYIELHNDTDIDFWVTNEDGEHIFHFRNMDKYEFLEFELERSKTFPMIVSKFIVPEVVEYFDISLEDLFIFTNTFNNIGRKHKYVKYIFDCYLNNGDFTLTNEQRDEAYQLYNSTR